MSILDLGASASTWLGFGIVLLFFSIVGVAGVMWIFAALCLLTAVLALALAQPSEERADHA